MTAMPIEYAFEQRGDIARDDSYTLDCLRQVGPTYKVTWVWPRQSENDVWYALRDSAALVRRDGQLRVVVEREHTLVNDLALVDSNVVWTFESTSQFVAPRDDFPVDEWLGSRVEPSADDWPQGWGELPV